MAVYSDLYDVTVRYAKDVSLVYRGLTEDEAQDINDIVAAGAPATVGYELGFDLIIPDKVQYVHAWRAKLDCPQCKSHTFFGMEKNCKNEAYHL